MNDVASLTENGTSNTLARVLARRVFPDPVGPLTILKQSSGPCLSEINIVELVYIHDEDIALLE